MQAICVQPDIVWENRQANFEQIQNLLAAATVKAQGLIVLPEMFASGFSLKVNRIAEPPERPTEHYLAQLAANHQAHVLGGLVTQNVDQRGLNQAVVYSPEGNEVARYTKHHPFRYAQEDQHYAPGDDIVVFDWQGARVAPIICYDLRFPELFRAAVRRGAQIFVVIANFPTAREDHWVTLLRARAIENQAYVIAANRTGKDPNADYPGRSMIINPKGEILADAGHDAGVIAASIDMEMLAEYRKRFPVLEDMRGG